jgi:hypothetical protein
MMKLYLVENLFEKNFCCTVSIYFSPSWCVAESANDTDNGSDTHIQKLVWSVIKNLNNFALCWLRKLNGFLSRAYGKSESLVSFYVFPATKKRKIFLPTKKREETNLDRSGNLSACKIGLAALSECTCAC